LNNYISAIGYGKDDAKSKENFEHWWPADLHVMAKDIVRFHAVYWPAFLMAAGLPLPKKLLVHGYVLVDEKKMSKSLGNAVDPHQLAEWYGAESVRYYLVRQMAVTQDGHFSLQDLEGRIGADLSNNLGNLLNRTLTLAINNGLETVAPVKTLEASSAALKEKCEEGFRSYWEGMNHSQYHIALADLWTFISQVNAFFHEQKPWAVAKENKELFAEIISSVCHSLYSIALMLWPIMPKKMEELLKCLGHEFDKAKNYDEELRKNMWNKTFVLKKTDKPLFPRHESHVEVDESESGDAQKKSAKASKTSKTTSVETISIKDVAKVELLVGTITSCEPLSGSDKLYKMSVDLGKRGERTILAGVAKFFKPDELIGKQGVVVANLVPRKMMGTESQGMMLFAKDDQGNFELTTVTSRGAVAGGVVNGTRLS
ncbi:class I tRNA ligase family protein, partial [Candidatus Babeliales bacterium]|nr:class I tRNA ligase family protein [Candidatus Babeliales bacterium]